MNLLQEKENRINKIIDDAAKALEAEGLQYFIGALDVQPQLRSKGTAFAQSDIRGDQMCHILDLAFPTNQDIINLGIYVGQLIYSRKNINKRSKKN